MKGTLEKRGALKVSLPPRKPKGRRPQKAPFKEGNNWKALPKKREPKKWE